MSKATIVYVDITHIGGIQTGTSWATAFSGFQAGINAANAGDSVWVAKGTYMPLSGTSFSMKDSVKIYGGFLNTDISFTQRSWMNNSTLLMQTQGSVIKNDANNLTAASILDGFTITSANSSNSWGAGMYNRSASPTIRNCIFLNNTTNISTTSLYTGGGIYNFEYASPLIENCIFQNNSAVRGGAIANEDFCDPIISHCTFIGNRAKHVGGAIFNYIESHPHIKNCNFYENSSDIEGGAIGNWLQVEGTIENCIFKGNTCNDYGGGAIENIGLSTPLITNCIFLADSSKAGFGGAIFNSQSSPVIANNLFMKNVADSLGAAIYNTESYAKNY